MESKTTNDMTIKAALAISTVIILANTTVIVISLTRMGKERAQRVQLERSLEQCRDSLREAQWESESWKAFFNICQRQAGRPTIVRGQP